MYRLQILNREQGYTLLEAVLQVVIFGMFAQLFILFFYWKEPIENQYQNSTTLSVEMFATDLQDELAHVQGIVVINAGAGIRFETERGMITIEKNGQVIRKTIGGLGHVPLITNVTNLEFKLDYPRVQVKFLLKDGIQMEREFIVGTY